ncbi:hypothetical protein ACO0RG_000372 [Hanseniaspora osmophila]
MVANLLIYHPILTRLIKLLDSVQGREKVLRLLQYVNRALFNCTGNNLNRQLSLQFALCRKILRFLKPLNNLQAASKAFDAYFWKNANMFKSTSTAENLVNIVKIAKILSYGGYLFLDQFNLLKMLNVCHFSPQTSKKISRYTNLCWFYGLASSLLVTCYEIKTAPKLAAGKRNDAATEDSGSLTETSTNQKWSSMISSYKRLVWDSLDMFIVLNNLKQLSSDDTNVALAGVTTSLLGVQDIWSKLRA